MKTYDAFAPNFLIVEPEKGRGIDPMNEAFTIAGTDWKAKGYNGLIWDTMTQTAWDVHMASANTTTFGNHIRLGTGALTVPVPSMGDYRAAHVVCDTLFNMLVSQELHVAVLGHEATETKGKGENVEILNAGFALVGQAKVSSYGAEFDQYIRLRSWAASEQGAVVMNEVRAQMLADPVFGAGLREPGNQIVPPYKVVPNTLEEQIEWWKWFFDLGGIDVDNPLTLLRLALYSRPKVGKSRLVTVLPAIVGPCVYVAWDRGSRALPSTWSALKTGGGSQEATAS